jgi:molecular chaperone GrpE
MNDEGTVKVNDRRRFEPDGSPRQEPEAQPELRQPTTDDEVAEKRELEEQLTAARKRIDELSRAWQSLDRDREDFKNRLRRERDQLIDVERGNVAVALLETIDGLDLALRNADETPFAKGVQLVRADLLKRVEALGLERLSVVGLPFDPNVAEAADMDITPNPNHDGQVTEEIRAGYKLKERVVRPARVKVARYVAPARA